MALQATINSQFMLCPPLDLPLRLNAENGRFGGARIHGTPAPGLCSDHFASVHPFEVAGLHQIHEAVDLASGAGSPVYAGYSGQVMSIGAGDVVISHQGVGLAYATQYIHVDPLPTIEVGKSVVKGQAIAVVQDRGDKAMGDHLHLELWHWVDDTPGPKLDNNAVPIDPTRLLYYWERTHKLDYAVVGALPAQTIPLLDAGVAVAGLAAAFAAAGIAAPVNPVITVLAAGCVWRIVGDDITYLLRAERGEVTVIDEAYGSQTILSSPISRIGFQYRLGYPTFMVEVGEETYGIPLHGVVDDPLLGRGLDETTLIALLERAYETQVVPELDIRRSAFWHMDGSLDEFAAVIEGVRLG
ncbi:MAG: peptidoglycan DD-metalloendopeptidase family protein [Acidimicrobiales bacterium]